MEALLNNIGFCCKTCVLNIQETFFYSMMTGFFKIRKQHLNEILLNRC